MSVTADSLLPRPKLDYDVGYDVVVKGASVVVYKGRTGLSPPTNYHNLSGDVAVPTNKI